MCENEATIEYYQHGSALTVAATQHNGWLVDLAQWFPKYG